MHIKIKTTSDYWKKHPTYDKAVRNNSCGLDIPTPTTQIIPGLSRAFSIHLEIKTEPNHSYMLLPRSSITKTPLRLANSVGIIDIGYRGELIAKVDNLSDEDYTIEAGHCYFQIVAFDGNLVTWELVSNLSPSIRGERGFGSTTNCVI